LLVAIYNLYAFSRKIQLNKFERWFYDSVKTPIF